MSVAFAQLEAGGLVRITEIAGRGRGVVAKVDLVPGQVVMRTAPLTATVLGHLRSVRGGCWRMSFAPAFYVGGGKRV